MSWRPEDLLRREVLGLEPYTPILPFEALSRRLGIPADQIVKLDANENPWGALPAVVEAVANYPYYHIYPDPQQTELREALARHLGVPLEMIFVSHGADEMLDYVCRLFLDAEDRIVNCPPTFGMYEFDAALEGARVHQIWRRPDYGVDVDAIDACCRYGEDEGERQPKLMFLTSPNNPTGTWLPDEDLRRLLALPVMIVLDEAYAEFSDYPSRVGWVAGHHNLIVLRTFSKAAGMAGLRLGYAVCPDWLMPHLWTFKQPYNVNVAAAVGGLASLRHADQMAEVVARIRSERQRLFDALCGVDVLRPVPSQANFILSPVEGLDARSLKHALEAQGILVRHYDKPGLSNCIRISVGRPDQTDRLVDALSRVGGDL